jgi:hypothetical protein
MSVEAPAAMRSRIEDGPEGLCVTIPVRKNWPMVVFAPIWLVGWVFGEFATPHSFVTGGPAGAFPVVWLAFWTLGGLSVFTGWLWQVAGQERVVAGPGTFSHRYQLLGRGWTREYDPTQMKELRVSVERANPVVASSGLRQWGIGGGNIAFDYGAKTVRFGSVDEAEAGQIVAQLARRLHMKVAASSTVEADAPGQAGPPEPEEFDPFWNKE